jgi:hypothetical protein
MLTSSKKLADVAQGLPQYFTYMEELFDVYTEMIRPLPLPVFRDFLSTATLPADRQIGLLANHILPLLAVPPKHPRIFEVIQDDLIKYYLPHAANATSIVENAKMSLLIENLLFYMWTDNRLEPTPSLTSAVEKGIRARRAKAIGDARKRDKGRTPEEEEARGVLEMSAERIELMLQMLHPGAVAGAGRECAEGEFMASSQLSELAQTPSADEDEDEDEDEDDEDDEDDDEDGDGDITVI